MRLHLLQNIQNEYKKSENIENILNYAKEIGINAIAFKDINEALNYVTSKNNADLILITGSLYLASDYLEIVKRITCISHLFMLI